MNDHAIRMLALKIAREFWVDAINNHPDLDAWTPEKIQEASGAVQDRFWEVIFEEVEVGLA